MIGGLDWLLKLDWTLIKLFRATYDRVAEAASDYENLHYIGNIFDQEETQIWIDTWGQCDTRR